MKNYTSIIRALELFKILKSATSLQTGILRNTTIETYIYVMYIL